MFTGQNQQPFSYQSNEMDAEEEQQPSTTITTPAAVSTPLPENRRHVTISMDTAESQSSSTRETHQAFEPNRQLEDLFTRMADSFAAALRCATAPENSSQSSTARTIPPPEFRGMEHESAHAFIEKMEDYFHTMGINDYSNRLAIITDQLKGDARRWYEPYRFLINRYTTFTDRLRAKFDSTVSLTQATARLYGDRQQPGENASVFITKKMCLFARVDNAKPEILKTSIILDQLRPELRSRLRGQRICTLEDLVVVASQIEADLQEIPQARTSSAPMERRVQDPPPRTNRPLAQNQPTLGSTTQSGPSTPCRYCPDTQWHYHSECHNNPYRNRQGNPQRNTQNSSYNREGQWRNNVAPTRSPSRNTQDHGTRERPTIHRGSILRAAETPASSHSLEENSENWTRTEEFTGRPSSQNVHPQATTQQPTSSQEIAGGH